jgi:hypothetical protein
MQQVAVEPSAPDSSFAAFLASLAPPSRQVSPEWNDDQLADDVATLSYEQALRTHRQFRSPASDQRPAPVAETGQSRPGHGMSGFPESALKRASITIRLSETECAQLRLRAAEAGLTVSAYLRSCMLEVESLRTQVKETLAQLRKPAPVSTHPVSAHPVPTPLPASKSKPWFRFWPVGRRLHIGGGAA